VVVPSHLLPVLVVSLVVDVSNSESREKKKGSFFDAYVYRLLLLRRIRDIRRKEVDPIMMDLT
jgi:hypothetical protein